MDKGGHYDVEIKKVDAIGVGGHYDVHMLHLNMGISNSCYFY